MGEARRVGWRDGLLPALILLVATVEAVTYRTPHLALVLAVSGAACAALVLRRRWPVAVALVSTLLPLGMSQVGPPVDELASPILVMVLAVFGLGRYLPDARGLAWLAAIFGYTVVLAVRSDGEGPDVTDVVFMSALLTPPYVFGLVMRTLADRNQRLTEQAELLARLQATVREDAVTAERSRIARELHDVLAHSISAMVVQASAAEDVVRRDPDRAARAMREVADTGRRALAETGRLLHLIRDSDDELGLAPDQGLEELDALVDQFRRSGLDVVLEVDGELAGLPAGVDLSAYRVVQEALTNALKYAPDRAALLRLRRSEQELVIEAENTGRPGKSTGSGLGLVGMAERVSVYGGRLEHGFTRDGRFTLSAALPLATVDA
ncbi:MAG TPA: histidine kinase [Mycobacteriales bacterium]|nr:histidine kinase [Mycobacteriales bacterium]